MNIFVFSICGLVLCYSQLSNATPFAYITNQLDNTVAIVDTHSRQVIKTLKIPGAPAGIAVGHHNNRVYVTTPENASFAIINHQTQSVIRSIYVGGSPLGIVIDEQDKYVYIADWYTNKVHIFDTQKQQLTKMILVGKSPSGMAFSADNQYLFVTNRLSNSISKINLSSGLPEKTASVGQHPFGLAIDERFVYVANVMSSDITILDVDNLSLVARIELEQDSLPYALTLALDNQRLLVSHQGDSYVGVIDTKTQKYIASIEVGDKPEGISTDLKNDKIIYVANWFDDTLSVIDVLKLTTIATVKVGKGARSFGKFIIP